MYYEQNIQGCLSDQGSASILGTRAFKPYIQKAQLAAQGIIKEYQAGELGALELLKTQDDIEALLPIADHYRNNFDDVVILGAGGSSLGGQTLAALKGYGSSLTASQPRLHFLDNIDPSTFDSFFERVNPERTGFIVISKSGATAETLCQFVIALERWKQALSEADIKRHFIVITEPKPSPLRQLAHASGIKILDHPLTIGGRFSALSLVGLLPAMIAGVNAPEVRRGGLSVIDRMLGPDLPEPVLGAALNVALLQKKNISNTVFMPYIDCFNSLGFWFRQLCAESLGKDGRGITPLNALGTVDQHSQLQLYLDGPKDKMFTVIVGAQLKRGGVMPQQLSGFENLSYLAGRTMGDLLDAEQRATIATLVNRGCPTRVIAIKEADECTLGALMTHFMLETMLTARLIGVNAFDQPAVEEGKLLTRQFLEERGLA